MDQNGLLIEEKALLGFLDLLDRILTEWNWTGESYGLFWLPGQILKKIVLRGRDARGGGGPKWILIRFIVTVKGTFKASQIYVIVS